MIRPVLFSLMVFCQSLFAGTSLEINPDFSRDRSLPWLIMITQAGCQFCERLESQLLQPLRASNRYTGRVQFAHVGIDRGVSIIDFDGTSRSGQEFAARYGAFGTPTLLFLGPEGQLLAENKYGVPDAIEFYGYHIESVLDALSSPQ